ncbi:MAG: sugar ABC transporter permease [Casimicrobiaceae bacterium]
MATPVVGVSPPPSVHRRRGVSWRRETQAWAFVAPVALLVGIGVLFPLGYVLLLSAFDYSPYLGKATQFIALRNYREVVADAAFWNALAASAIWVLGSVVPQFLLGLCMALVLNERFHGRGIVRTIILAPWAVSGVVTGFIWMWIFDGTIGVLNDLLMKVGLVDAPVPWGIYDSTTWLMVLVANAWRGAPFFAIVILAALQAIDPALYEAASIDGGTRSQKFRFITWPLIFNAVVISTLLRALWTFNFIDLLWTMTRGGPAGATTTLPIYIFDVVYQKGQFGYGAALSVVLCVILVTFSLVYWQLNRMDRTTRRTS